MNKDESADRLLRHTSGSLHAPRPDGVCLEAETLAAWTDGSLTALERTAAEAHAADCDRCLAVLAAMARTSPLPSAADKPGWLSIRWLVPLTTAAVAIAAWVIVQQPRPFQGSDAPAVPAVVDALTPAQPTVQADRDPGPPALADALEKKTASPAHSKSGQPDSRSQSAGSAGSDVAVTSKRTDPQAEAPTAPARSRPAAPPVAAAASPAAPTPRAEAHDERLQSAARGVAIPLTIVSPDPSVRWRIVARSIEQSTDGGRTWIAQPTGTDSDLLAGASPAPGVCWIVGRSGLVLLSTDGQTWRRLDFPAPTADVVSVTASDRATATVTTADGRTYRTADSGRTWTVQENPAAPF